MAKWKELPPSPEAIVKAALERAAKISDATDLGTNAYADKLSRLIAKEIRALASDPAEVAAIIKNAAGEDRG
jgi:hypothetical protein